MAEGASAITLHHKPNIWSDLQRCSILTRLLIAERRSVLFVGEGDFSFTVAFAALREFERRGYAAPERMAEFDSLVGGSDGVGLEHLVAMGRRGCSLKELVAGGATPPSWQELAQFVWGGIISTRYEPVGSVGEHQFVGEMPVACKPAPHLCEVKLECFSACADYMLKHRQDGSSSSVAVESHVRLKMINLLPGVPCCFAWQYRINALAISPALTESCQVMWFQCPWVANGHTHTLISKFLLNLAGRIRRAAMCA